MTALQRIRHRYFTTVFRYISFVLSKPRLVIMIPCIVVFVMAYNVLYDFTIKRFNSQLAAHFGSVSALNFNTNPRPNSQLVSQLSEIDFSVPKSLSSIVLAWNKETIIDTNGDDNVFDVRFFTAMDMLVSNLTTSFDHATVISPLSSLPIDITSPTSLSYGHRRAVHFSNYVIKFFNYDINNMLTFLFFNKLMKSNHIIKYSQSVRVFVIYDQGSDLKEYLTSVLPDIGKVLAVDTIITTTNTASIRDFVHYYFVQNNSSLPISVFLTVCNSVVFTSVLVLVLLVYLSIANEHKIRSSVGLLIGWLVSGLIASTAAVSLISQIHNYSSWRLIFEPSTMFTKAAYMFAVMLLSARNLFTTINFLSNKSGGESDLHKRLYYFYTGWHGLPILLKSLFFNIVGLFALQCVGIYLLYYYTEGYFFSYVSHRFARVGEAIVVSLVIDFILQLSFLSAIIVIDLKRMDLTDYIQNHQNFNISDGYMDSEDGESRGSVFEGVNIFSSLLLNLQAPSDLRPPRKSLRHSLGQSFLKVNSSTTFHGFGWGVLIIGLIQLLGIFIHWVLVIPYHLLNDKSSIMGLGETIILHNSNTLIYYLELISILLFIVAVSFLAFKFSHDPATTASTPQQFTEKDFLPDARYFNAIELPKGFNMGHTLDIIKIEANSKTSFVVTIGLDHKVLVWSPLSNPISKPIDISTTLQLPNGSKTEFWPINHVSISDDGSYIILINYKYGLMKCFERQELCYKWEVQLTEDLLQLIANKKFKILESFFRRRTVPGFLARKMLMNKKATKGRSRRGSDASTTSVASAINGNFPPPISMKSHGGQQRERHEPTEEQLSKELLRDEFTIVLETGDLISFSCGSGKTKTTNILEAVYGDVADGLSLISALKVTTPRVNDRIVCQISNSDLIVATAVNNNWKFRKLPIKEGTYNQELKIQPLRAPPSRTRLNDFSSVYQEKIQAVDINSEDKEKPKSISDFQINRATIVSVEFVGMIVIVKDQVAELIDIQSGIVLKKFNIGSFKPSTFRVSHSEPTHCRFCGCASIQSFSILYEDYDSPTLIIHTYKIDIKRSKTNICLRVERDPREIRCLGFNAVTDHQFWYNNIVGWELTDVNMVIGLKRKHTVDDDDNHGKDLDSEEDFTANIDTTDLNSIIEYGGLGSLRNRNKKKTKAASNVYKSDRFTIDKAWESFIITVLDGQMINYQIPLNNKLRDTDLIMNKINCVKKYGYKSIIFNVGNLSEVFYLGNDKLIENDLYYSGTNATIWSVLEEDAQNNGPGAQLKGDSAAKPPQAVNSELLFINKRRKMRERSNIGGNSIISV
ncbi:predicted protein [Scheffersomyces stipitis CBS 6054]|uniref:SSD domain-containing protein n=1 Tax=Scheffersomyces stipitis (strain ATCC 58785 / CBS 6054 / NBRC 10063 / NRRL Y-11545) TaxID=322104 RepID=A3M0P8_PICST|nr:predicted protein [Scheffersomyces stipitis CBS 6054]ABN68570.2 predicted protein [Scheffersomyces stipitis CBS 6054]